MNDTNPVQSIDASAEILAVSTPLTEPTEQAAPIEVSVNPFAELGLAAPLVQAVTDMGYTAPTTVQSKVIPLALPNGGAEGADNERTSFIDLMVSSQTGSGKLNAN